MTLFLLEPTSRSTKQPGAWKGSRWCCAASLPPPCFARPPSRSLLPAPPPSPRCTHIVPCSGGFCARVIWIIGQVLAQWSKILLRGRRRGSVTHRGACSGGNATPIPACLHSAPPAASPVSQEADDKSPGCLSAKQTGSPLHFFFLEEQTKLERGAWQASCFLSGTLELGERRCILMAPGWTEIRILVAEAAPALL